MQLGELAGDNDMLRAAEDGLDVFECVENAVRRLVENLRAGVLIC